MVSMIADVFCLCFVFGFIRGRLFFLLILFPANCCGQCCLCVYVVSVFVSVYVFVFVFASVFAFVLVFVFVFGVFNQRGFSCFPPAGSCGSVSVAPPAAEHLPPSPPPFLLLLPQIIIPISFRFTFSICQFFQQYFLRVSECWV